MWSLNAFLGVKIIHLVDRADLFKIIDLVYGGREIVTSLYSSLEGQRQTVYCGCSELAVSLFVSVKINGLGNFVEQLTLYTSTAFWTSSFLLGRIPYCTLREKLAGRVKEFTGATALETALRRWEPVGVKY
jgi:hypothetical protein